MANSWETSAFPLKSEDIVFVDQRKTTKGNALLVYSDNFKETHRYISQLSSMELNQMPRYLEQAFKLAVKFSTNNYVENKDKILSIFFKSNLTKKDENEIYICDSGLIDNATFQSIVFLAIKLKQTNDEDDSNIKWKIFITRFGTISDQHSVIDYKGKNNRISYDGIPDTSSLSLIRPHSYIDNLFLSPPEFDFTEDTKLRRDDSALWQKLLKDGNLKTVGVSDSDTLLSKVRGKIYNNFLSCHSSLTRFVRLNEDELRFGYIFPFDPISNNPENSDYCLLMEKVNNKFFVRDFSSKYSMFISSFCTGHTQMFMFNKIPRFTISEKETSQEGETKITNGFQKGIPRVPFKTASKKEDVPMRQVRKIPSVVKSPNEKEKTETDDDESQEKKKIFKPKPKPKFEKKEKIAPTSDDEDNE